MTKGEPVPWSEFEKFVSDINELRVLWALLSQCEGRACETFDKRLLQHLQSTGVVPTS